MAFKEDAMFRPEELDNLDNTLYEPKAEELVLRTLINVKTDIDEGAETYSYDVIKRSGVAKIIAPQADDIPLVEADLERHTVQIYSIATAFKVYMQEMRASRKTGRNIDTTKAGIARRAIAEKENKIGWIGETAYNINGIVNTTGIQTETVAENSGENTEWEEKTGMEILDDLRKGMNAVNELPGHTADTLCLPANQFEMLEKPVNDNDTRPIREYLQQVGWFQTIQRAPDLKEQGDTNSDCFLIFDSSPEVMELLLPMDVTRHDEEYKFPYWKVPIEERTGGVIIRYPMAVYRGDGI